MICLNYSYRPYIKAKNATVASDWVTTILILLIFASFSLFIFPVGTGVISIKNLLEIRCFMSIDLLTTCQ